MKVSVLGKVPLAVFENPDHELHYLTIDEFAKLAPQKIDCNPIGQRPSIEESPIGKANSPSKAQGILHSIIMSNDIGEIKLAKNEIGSKSRYGLESIDGGHRKRSILSFINGEFPIHLLTDEKVTDYAGKYYYQLTDEQRQKILSYNIRFVVYNALSNKEKGEKFRDSNNGTYVNHQEMMNSYGDIPIANFIRNTARIVLGIGNKPHILFKSKGGEFEFLDFANSRLIHDKIVARITYMCLKGEILTICGDKQVEEMYCSEELWNQEKVNELAKKVINCLNFIFEIAEGKLDQKKEGLSYREVTVLSRLYFYLKQECRKEKFDFKIASARDFYLELDTAIQRFADKQNGIATIITDNQGKRTMCEAWGGYLGSHHEQSKIENSILWLFSETSFNPFKSGTLIKLHSKRCFTKQEIEAKLAEQGFKCWITGEHLKTKDAQGGHIKSHANGGTTTVDNLVVIHKDHNITMGQMNAEDYKILYLEKVEKEKNQQPIRKVAKRK